jgi:hypothetical protein
VDAINIHFTFTQDDARIVFGLLSSFAVPFVVSAIKQYHWSNRTNFLIAVGISLLAGFLTEYIAGTLSGTKEHAASAVVVAIGIFTAAQAHFATWFQSLGFEKALNPQGQP